MVNRITRPLVRSASSVTRLKSTLKKIPGLTSLVRLCRLIVQPGHRSEWLLTREKPDNLFQPYSCTKHNRWPQIFAFIRERLSDEPDTSILSFGCSTGEEVFTLRRYLPHAKIVGIDINPRSISVCLKKLKKNRDQNIQFKHAGSPKVEPDAFYDAVFCMSVLRHGELGASNPQSCDHLIRFNDFENTVTNLCRCIKPGGYLVMIGSNFRFCDTSIASEFDVAFNLPVTKPSKDTPLYDSNNCRMTDDLCKEVVFRKKTAD
jgi:SAM-dependent methyltransferase